MTLSAALKSRFQSPLGFLLLAILSVQLGSALAKGLFVYVSPVGVAFLRLALASAVLLMVTRPRWREYSWSDYRLLGLFGLSMGAMNSLLYSAIAYIPLGVAVTLEFLGPLAVALAHSRRALDGLWVALAAGGILLLTPLPGSDLDPLGVVLALGAGGCWAAYILLSARVGKTFQGSEGLAMALGAGALVVLPLALAQSGLQLFSPPLLGLGLGVAMLASALPYSLEMAALRRLPIKVFGVLMSLEPAMASFLGLILLGEQLSPQMIAAIALVSIAAAGSAAKP
ncbi:EamA family transporter [Leptolyngbya sp. PCC 6406]|uniref:EamA family transporter n=1 Tax=Leptolyngbya sp. PCC 6406 TaxID=1173264 RepID=UPI00056253DE|nr:EamA family transporter [Leptolyngbya sp. PCC 6406]